MGVWKRNDTDLKPWFFKFQHRGNTIRRYGYLTKAEATVAEAHERVKLQSLGASDSWITIVEKRLAALHAYSTKLWFVTCKNILQSYSEWYDLPVTAITTDMVRTRILKVASDKGNSVANRHIIVLKAAFNLAIGNKVLTDNPCRGIKFLPTNRAAKVIPPREHIDKVLALADPTDQAYLTVICFTAARVGEVNGMRWDDVDFPNRRLRLWTRKKKGGSRKARTVVMTQRVFDALALQNTFCRHGGTPWVFTNPAMRYAYPDNPEKWRYIYRDKFLKTLCRKAGVQEFTYHALRHYAASAMAEAGVPTTAIQSVLGHENVSTTDIYLQSLGRAESALSALDDS